MTDWAPKRFWTQAEAVQRETRFSVELDGRPVKTPYKQPLILPTLAMAEAIALEWQAQSDLIDPTTMPATRAANSAIDKVAPQHAEVVDILAAYGENDLLCYRAAQPQALIDQQAAAWDPWLAWAAQALEAPLHVTTGVMPIDQPAQSIARMHARVARFDNFALTGFHDLVQLSGSLVLAFAVAAGKLTAHAAWPISRVDENFQISQWGDDEEAAEVAGIKRQAFIDGAAFMAMNRAT
ncbi:ATP12 family chaperone protein [Loktanella sp. DJP18]|uniref:ATP12 family chaperone protein n=1 Tax=Loktanella sp. DJP18 TaxID=3409788 RepID=UPI003BB6FC86